MTVKKHCNSFFKKSNSLLQQHHIHNLIDSRIDRTPFLLLLPIRLKAGTWKNIVNLLLDKSDKIYILRIPTSEQSLRKLHLEKHSSETRHEEEHNKEELYNSTNICKHIK